MGTGHGFQSWFTGVASLNFRLKRPVSHARSLARVAFCDAAWGGASPLIAYFLRGGMTFQPVGVATYCAVALLASLLVFQWFQTSSPISRFYSIRDALELLKACVLIAALSAAAAFLLTRLDAAPRSIPILHLMLLASGLLGARLVLRLRETRREAARGGAAEKVEHVVLIQASRLAWLFSKMVEELAPAGYQIVAILDERPEMKRRSLSGYPIIGAPTELERIVADYAMHGVCIDAVLLAERPQDLSAAAWDEISRVCQALRINLEVLPERLISTWSAADKERAPAARSGEISTVAQANPGIPLDRRFWKIKRGTDVAVALSLAVLTFPIAVVVCVLVLLDIGMPVVFWQRRVGRNGAPLYLYKFRTLQAPFDPATRKRRDVREPSSLGRFLRMTRLDEWPQLWNVVTGGMSLIGPRPLLPADQPKNSSFRLAVRPGVTGWAQICGGKAVSAEEKNALDEWYIRHASLKLDLGILARTALTLFTGDRRDEKSIAAALLDRLQNGFAAIPARTDYARPSEIGPHESIEQVKAAVA